MVVFEDKPRTVTCSPLEQGACHSMFCFEECSSLLQEIASHIDRVAEDHKQGTHIRTVFDEILESNLRDVDKERQCLFDEARMITFAGTEPLSWTLSVRLHGTRDRRRNFANIKCPRS